MKRRGLSNYHKIRRVYPEELVGFAPSCSSGPNVTCKYVYCAHTYESGGCWRTAQSLNVRLVCVLPPTWPGYEAMNLHTFVKQGMGTI